MSVLDISMLIIAIVFAVVVGFQVFKLVKAIKDKKARRNSSDVDDVSSNQDKKGE